MATDLFTPETASTEALAAAFDAALFDVAVDPDGDLIVRDRYTTVVALHSAGLLRFTCVFGVRAGAPEEAGHALCNRINDVLVVVRASLHDATTLVIDWYLPLSGGIAKKAVVRAFRRFVEITATIGRFDDDDLLE